MNVSRSIGSRLLLFSEVPGMHGECLSRADERCVISAFLPHTHPLIAEMDLYDDELPLQFFGQFDVAIEDFDGVLLVAILADDAQKKKEGLSEICKIGNAFQRGGHRASRHSPKECRLAVVRSTGGIERRELRIDLFHGGKAIRSPELPVEDGVRSFDGAGIPRTPRRIEDDHHIIVTPPPDVASHHAFLIDGSTEARAVVLLDDIGERQSQSEEHDGEDPECLGGGRSLNAEEELLLFWTHAADTQKMDGCLAPFYVARSDEIHLHHLLSDCTEEADRVEHVLRSPLLFLPMRLGASM